MNKWQLKNKNFRLSNVKKNIRKKRAAQRLGWVEESFYLLEIFLTADGSLFVRNTEMSTQARNFSRF